MPPESKWKTLLAVGVIIATGLVCYANSFGGPFIFDDRPSILENPSLDSLAAAWFPPPNITTTGRPVLNVTFALNRAISGDAVWSYHAINLLVHVLAALVLFGVMRRTLRQPVLAGRFGAVARELALLVALLWLVHPLQTESVTYIVQRAESLAGLFYLLTLYGLIRSAGSERPGRWHALTAGACIFGMACKEVMVSAPLMALLYDRTFLVGSFREAWRVRRRLYLLLAATWLPLAWLVAGTEGRGGSAGFATDVSAWHYLLTQCQAVVHYLRLGCWPQPLVLDYGTAVVQHPSEVWWQALLLLGLFLATVVALIRRPVWGFAGVWFFATLAPSSSFVPVATQTIAEHRMYLPLVLLAAVVVLLPHAALGRRSWWLVGAAIAVAATLTIARNADYRSALAIWTDTAAAQPQNARAHYNLSIELTAAGRATEAVAQLEEALRLQPDYPEAHLNLGNALGAMGRRSEARGHYEAALRAQPDYAEALVSLGYWFAGEGQFNDAIACYGRALQLRPDYPEAHNNLGESLARMGDLAGAAVHFETALRAKPTYAEAHNNLAGILLQQGRQEEAIPHFATALRQKPDLAEAHSNLAYALLQTGRLGEAIGHYRRLLQLEPGNTTAHNNLGFIYWRQGQLAAAIAEYEATLRIEPDNTSARDALAQLSSGK
jgi:tetratricopeptide (TPR) repeat protein